MTDDNKVKLLKIQYALLEALTEKLAKATSEYERETIKNEIAKCLVKYRELVSDVDYNIYHELQEKIKLLQDCNDFGQELTALEEIEVFYNQLVEIQNRFQKNYQIHTKEPLVLADLKKLNIETYLKRKETIKGYLVNQKNIEENKKRLEKLSEQLIIEEQKENELDKRIAFLEQELIRKFLSSEGRLLVQDDGKETLKYTSIAKEYEQIGIKITNNGYEGKLKSEIEAHHKEAKEKLVAATISYDAMPSIDTKVILDEITKEAAEANYQLVMIKLLEEVYHPSRNCEDAIQKREKIIDLLRYRKTYLETLNVKHGVDPFTRIYINEQLSELKKFESATKRTSKARHEVAELNSYLEKLNSENVSYLKYLKESSKSIEEIKQTEKVMPSFNDFTIEIVKPAEVHFLDNQVVNVRPVSKDLNIRKIEEITGSVIKRVYELLVAPKVEVTKDISPDLVIEARKAEETKPEPQDLFATNDPFTDDNIDHLNIDSKLSFTFDEQPKEIPTTISQDSNIEKNLESIDLFTTSDPFTDDNIVHLNVDSKPRTAEPIQKSSIPEESLSLPELDNELFQDMEMPDLGLFEEEDDLFSETLPFEKPTLFHEKVEGIEQHDVFPTIESVKESTPLVVPPTIKVDEAIIDNRVANPLNSNLQQSLSTQPVEVPQQTISAEELKLDENQFVDARSGDFWSTDVDVNNLHDMTISLEDSMTPRRKGV